MILNEKEKSALKEKLRHPEKKVVCPRCGKEILYFKRGNSIAAECEDQTCIFGGIRGL